MKDTRNSKEWSGRRFSIAANAFVHAKLFVDSALPDGWLKKINSIRGVEIIGTCAGHKDGPDEPYVMFMPSRQPKHRWLSIRLDLLVVGDLVPLYDPDEQRFLLLFD